MFDRVNAFFEADFFKPGRVEQIPGRLLGDRFRLSMKGIG